MQDLGEVKIQTIPYPKDTNPAGNVFGGWIMSQIDMAGSITARQLAPGRVVTASVKEINFTSPILVGDTVRLYGKILKVGNSSITVRVDIITSRADENCENKSFNAANAILTFVSVDENGNKKSISQEAKNRFGLA